MDSVRFSYGEFRDYHRGLGSVAEDVVVRLCIADYPVIKYANPERGEDGGARRPDGPRRPFINQSMTARELPEDDVLMRHNLFSLQSQDEVLKVTRNEEKKPGWSTRGVRIKK
jgi:hypothetical protein